jgi:hypothetical protein
MITATQIREELIPRLADLSVMSQLVNVIYVDSNPATIEYTEVQKQGNSIVKTQRVEQYKLKKHKLILKKSNHHSIIISDEVNSETIQKDGTLCGCFSMRINRGFMNVIDTFSKIEKASWSYFNRNFFSKIFLKRTPSDLVHKIIEFGKDSSYIIIPETVADVIMKSNFFDTNSRHDDSFIKNIGILKIDGISLNVYLDCELKENKIYFGKYDSVNIILNKNLNIIENKKSEEKTSITVEVDYAFIQKEAIKCLSL